MLTLKQLTRNLYPLFKVMTDTGMVLEILYKGDVYQIEIKSTGRKAKATRPKRVTQTTVQEITTDSCAQCESLMFNGVCMNTRCPSNKST